MLVLVLHAIFGGRSAARVLHRHPFDTCSSTTTSIICSSRSSATSSARATGCCRGRAKGAASETTEEPELVEGIPVLAGRSRASSSRPARAVCSARSWCSSAAVAGRRAWSRGRPSSRSRGRGQGPAARAAQPQGAGPGAREPLVSHRRARARQTQMTTRPQTRDEIARRERPASGVGSGRQCQRSVVARAVGRPIARVRVSGWRRTDA